MFVRIMAADALVLKQEAMGIQNIDSISIVHSQYHQNGHPWWKRI